MKKILLCLLLANSFTLISKAQNRSNEFTINIEPALGKESFGLGLFGKYGYGVSKSSLITISAGISKFSNSGYKPIEDRVKTTIIPLLVGYKHYFHSFFVEPQIGLGSLSGRIDIGGDFSRPSVAVAIGSISAGYRFNSKFNAGLRFLAAHGIESSNAGYWYNKDFNYYSLFFGYNIMHSKK